MADTISDNLTGTINQHPLPEGSTLDHLLVSHPVLHSQLQSVISLIPSLQLHGLTTVLVTVHAGGICAQLNVGHPGPSVWVMVWQVDGWVRVCIVVGLYVGLGWEDAWLSARRLQNAISDAV